jgi:equilibrative nucleoside transporter 1/2/3
MVFPAITGIVTSVENSTSIWLQPLMFNAIHFFLFNLGDLVSRYAPLVPWLFITSPRILSIISAARTLFVPLFIFCKVTPSSHPLINSDLVFQLLVFLLGLSNGYLSATLQICAPSLEYNPNLKNRRIDVDTASTVIGFTLSIGLVLGGFASFAAKAAICGSCNPTLE